MCNILSTITLSTALLAGAQAPSQPNAQPRVQADTLLTTRFTIDTTTTYFHRGIHQESSELILQPGLSVGGEITRRSSFRVGTWNSLHEGSTSGARGPGGARASGGNGLWYESDFYVGGDFELSRELTQSSDYRVLSSPNGSFANTQEFGFTIHFDDSEATRNGRMKGHAPPLTLVTELSGGRDAGSDRGTYFEIGIEPEYQLTRKLTITAPVILGMSLGNYYENARGNDDTFGFLSVGRRGTLPPSNSRRYPWQLTGGIEILTLGGSTKALNAGDDLQFLASLGRSLSW